MRVLLISGESSTAQTVELILKAEGFCCLTTDIGEDGADLAGRFDYDAILLDLHLTDMHGLDVLRAMRAAKLATPVLIISDAADISLKVKTFAAGADDFLAIPFHRDELVARIHALIRRSKGLAESKVTVGDITVDLDRKLVTVNGVPAHFTGKEYQIVELLALRRNSTITKDMFLNHLYGGRDEPEIKIIDVFVCKVRRKLRDLGAETGIATVWGRGYRLSVPAQLAAVAA